MKKIILVCFIALNFSAFAQEKNLDTKERSFVAFSAGGIFPMGTFASTAPSIGSYLGSDFPGFAETGFHLEVEGSKFLTNNFGISGMIGFGYNAFDKNAYENLTNLNGTTYNDPNQQIQQSVNFDNYHHIFVMIGPTAGFRQGKIAFDGRFLFGAMNTSFFNGSFTQTTTTTDYSSGQVTSVQTDKDALSAPSSTSLAFSVGISLRYSITDQLALLFKAEGIWASQKYNVKDNATSTYGDPVNGYSSSTDVQTTNISMPISMFNIGIGIAREF